MHFRFYRGTGAGFLNLSSVDIYTRQVFFFFFFFLVRGPVYCRVCFSIHKLYPLDVVVTSSLSQGNQKCVQTLLARYPWGIQFLVENHWAGMNSGFPLFSRREILLTGLEWWRWSWDEQMGLQRPGDNSAVLGWTDPSRWSSPQYSLCFPPLTFHLLWRKNLVLCWRYS